MARVTPYPNRVQDTLAQPGMSSGTGSGHVSGRPFDLHRYRAVFPDKWRDFLRANFQSEVHVAYMFGVDAKTGRNWWEGTNSPSGAFVAVACHEIPGALAMLFGRAA